MGNSSSSLPYAIGPEVHPPSRPGSCGWAVHSGSRKSDSLPVTVFKASKSSLAKTPLGPRTSQTQILPALHHFRKSKTLVHPNVLRTYATLDTDYPGGDAPDVSVLDPSDPSSVQRSGTILAGELIIVTERCRPLSDYLDGLPARGGDDGPPASAGEAVAWGLHDLINALGFLHNTAKLAHGAVCPHSVYVTPAGDFKLFGLSLLTPVGIEDGGGGPTRHFRALEGAVCPEEFRSPERVEGRYDAIAAGPVHAMDSFGLGALMEAVYGHPSAGTGGRVPQQLRKAVQRLRTANLRMRPRVLPLLRCPVFDTPHIAARDFLDNIAAKPSEEKIRFLQSLPDLLGRGVLGRDVAVHRVLPVLVATVRTLAGQEGAMAQDVNRREVMAVVPPLFQIAESHLGGSGDGGGGVGGGAADSFSSHVAPVVEMLFQVNDRAVRGALLSRSSLLASRLDPSSLNSAVFEPMCSGFTDSSGPLRELTLKSTVALVPHLSPPNLEKLTRYLVRLQSDPEPSIRTNTAIFIGKIAPSLGEVSRQKLILPAFARAMRDEFPPCRLAGLRAVRACREYYGPREVAERVMPAVVPHLVDGTAEVRDEAFGVVDTFVEGLREESGRMKAEEGGRGGAAAAAAAAGGGVGVAASPAAASPATAPASASAGTAAAASASAAAAAPAPSAPSSGGYLSSFGSWAATRMTASAQAPPPPATAAAAAAPPAPSAPATAPAPAASAPAAPAAGARAPVVPPARFTSLSLSDANIGGYGGSGAMDAGGGGDGWSDEDEDADDVDDDDDGGGGGDLLGTPPGEEGGGARVSTPNWAKKEIDDEDDIFASFDAKPGVAARAGRLGGGAAGGASSSGGGGGRLLTTTTVRTRGGTTLAQRRQRAGAKKLAPDEGGGLDDGWDDF